MNTTVDFSFALDYLGTDTAPDQAGLVLTVKLGGQPIGTLHCIRPDHRKPQQLAWHGMNEGRTASGDAHATRKEAAQDVLAWHEGRHAQYVPQCVVPLVDWKHRAEQAEADNQRLIQETWNWSQAVKKLEAERADKWIAVEERLPKDGELVLLALASGKVTFIRYELYRMEPYWGYHNGDTPTYWQPLPLAPSKQAEPTTLPFLQACPAGCQNASGLPSCGACPFPQEGGEVA